MSSNPQEYQDYPDFVTSTGYGSGDGLCGWNCPGSAYVRPLVPRIAQGMDR